MFFIMKMEIVSGCNECGVYEKLCPMDIKFLDYKKANQRICQQNVFYVLLVSIVAHRMQ